MSFPAFVLDLFSRERKHPFCPFLGLSLFCSNSLLPAILDSHTPSVPSALCSTLDGPRWAPPPAGRGRTRSQSCDTSAPVKPLSFELSAASQASLQLSSRRLFASDSEDGDDPDSDLDVTPRLSQPNPLASIASQIDPTVSVSFPRISPDPVNSTSFLRDFLSQGPPRQLARDLHGIARGAASVASAGAALASRVFPTSHSSSVSSLQPSPPSRRSPSPAGSPSLARSLSPARTPSLGPPRDSMPMAATILPLPSAIKLTRVDRFNGTPADLSRFHTQIHDTSDTLDVLTYFGECVTGSVATGFDYVPTTV